MGPVHASHGIFTIIPNWCCFHVHLPDEWAKAETANLPENPELALDSGQETV